MNERTKIMTKREMAVVVIPAHQTHFRKKKQIGFPRIASDNLIDKFLFYYNHGQNIFRLFHALAHILFTTSESELDYYEQQVNV